MVSNPIKGGDGVKGKSVGDKIVVCNIWRPIGKVVEGEGKNQKVLPQFLRFGSKVEVDGAKLEFNWKEKTYVLDPEYVDKFDEKNRPIIDFLEGHMKPIHLRLQKVPENDDSRAFYVVYVKGQLGAILSAATKLVAQQSTWIMILAGFGLGVMASLIMVHFGLFGQIYTAPTPSSGGITGG